DRAVHDDDRSRQASHHSSNLIDLAFADIGRRPDVVERYETRLHDGEIYRARETDGLFKARVGRTRTRLPSDVPPRRHLEPGLDDDCTTGLAVRFCRT